MQYWLKLSPSQFEELMFHLLHREGFHNVTWHGESGGDRGRDLTCERIEFVGTKIVRQRCIVQCKRYKGSISRAVLYEDLAKASAFSPDYFILATTGVISSTTKDWLIEKHAKMPYRILLWERTDLDVLLYRHQDLRARFLGLRTEESFVLSTIATHHKHFSSITDWPMCSILRGVLHSSWDYAFRNSTNLTVGHLLLSLLLPKHAILRMFIKHCKMQFTKIKSIAIDIAQSQVADVSIRKWISMTPAYMGVIQQAYALSRLHPFGIVDEKLVLLSIAEAESGSIRIFFGTARIDQGLFRKYLLERHYTEPEAYAILQHKKSGMCPASDTMRMPAVQ